MYVCIYKFGFQKLDFYSVGTHSFMILISCCQNDCLKLYHPRQCSRKITNLTTINTFTLDI